MKYIRMLPHNDFFARDPASPVYDIDHISVVGPIIVDCIGYEDTIFYDVPAIYDTDGIVYLREKEVYRIFSPDSSD